jgi:hypothetical protein
MIALATSVTATAGLLLVSPPSASATTASCHSSAKQINGTDPNGHWPPYGYAVTTSNCNDINVKLNQTEEVATCFQPSSRPIYCNDRRPVYANVWGLAATDVLDGTKFWLIFDSEGTTGVAAY